MGGARALVPAEDRGAILREVLEFLQAEIQDRDILVEQRLARNPPLLQLDREQIKQAFYNICRNAFQAMKAGGILRIETSVDPTHVSVVFADTGGGIAPENITRIFEPYFTTWAKDKRIGMGLSVCRETVAAHHGAIEVLFSQPGNTCFRVTLPTNLAHPEYT